MSGQIDFEPGSSPLARPKALVGVFRYLGPGNYQLLPNVVAEEVQVRFGASPGTCLCRYTGDGYGTSGYPVRFEDVIPLSASGPYLVHNDDRVVVVAFDPWGEKRFLFDGFTKIPQADLTAAHERITFQAIGGAEREWDTPLGGAWWRDADHPAVAHGHDTETDIPARFNPDGLANATDDGANGHQNGYDFPTFLDPLVCQARGIGRKWSLAMAARYILGVGNPDETYVKRPDGGALDQLLDAWTPADGQTIDPSDSSTYNVNPIVIREQVVTGKTWPVALDELLRPHGFGMRFDLEADVNGDPVTRLVLWRRDSGDKKRYKALSLQKPGSDLDPAQTNLAAAQINRDGSQIANQITVETDLLHHEASFILAPGFTIASADTSNRANYLRTSPNYPRGRDAYRTFVFDETGDGHWDLAGGAWKTGSGTDLVKVLGLANQDSSLYVKRRRPGRTTLISKDPAGLPQKATLAISFDYNGPSPGVWDGTGTWRPIKGEWSLLKDRLGIHLDCQDPNAFHVGSTGPETGRKASQSIRGVEWLAGNPQIKFTLRLTTVIEGDQRAQAIAPRRPASPTRFTIIQNIDAKDRYKVELISMWSEFSTKPGGQGSGQGEDTFGRKDTLDAINDAWTRQAAQEIPHLAGTMRIDRLTLAYRIGDRIKCIQGRDVDLQTNAGGGGREAPTYAEIVGINTSLGARQATTLLLSDQRADYLA